MLVKTALAPPTHSESNRHIIWQKWISVLLFSLTAFYFSTIAAQAQTLKPTRDQAALTLVILHPKTKTVFPNQWVKLTSDKTGKAYEGTTNEKGAVQFLVPIASTYTVHLKGADDYMEIPVSNKPFLDATINIPFLGNKDGQLSSSKTLTLVNFKFTDFSHKPVEGEWFIIHPIGGKDTAHFRCQTKADGKVQIQLPRGMKFALSLRYYENIDTVKMDADLDLLEYQYEFISSKQTEARRAEKARLIAEREAKFKADLEAYKKMTQPDVVFTSTLGRNEGWKNKLIVVDVTGSMYPYMEQVLTWFKLNFAKGDKMQFVLFNDGDDTPDHKKVIGKTGGIYTCSDCDAEKLANLMAKATTAGGGGDGPENNIEALREGLTKLTGYTDVIMVADNYADIKDKKLTPEIQKLQIPIKIVLCGLRGNEINEDYLNLAYKTGGSVHTIEGDMYQIAKTLEGEKITINGKEYILKYGRFVPFSRL